MTFDEAMKTIEAFQEVRAKIKGIPHVPFASMNPFKQAIARFIVGGILDAHETGTTLAFAGGPGQVEEVKTIYGLAFNTTKILGIPDSVIASNPSKAVWIKDRSALSIL